jgi:hypothetical protein
VTETDAASGEFVVDEEHGWRQRGRNEGVDRSVDALADGAGKSCAVSASARGTAVRGLRERLLKG